MEGNEKYHWTMKLKYISHKYVNYYFASIDKKNFKILHATSYLLGTTAYSLDRRQNCILTECSSTMAATFKQYKSFQIFWTVHKQINWVFLYMTWRDRKFDWDRVLIYIALSVIWKTSQAVYIKNRKVALTCKIDKTCPALKCYSALNQ